MKSEIHVSCAVIINDLGQILAVQRSEKMSMPLKWEFPGGKIEEGELPKETLVREIHEELRITIKIQDSLTKRTHIYDSFIIILYPYLASIVSGTITLVEHKEMRWMNRQELLSLQWAEADLSIVEELLGKS